MYKRQKLHVDKFDFEIFHELTQMGLAERIDNNWYNVEKKTANELMTFLTSVIANKIDFQPTTDKIDYSFATTYIRNQDIELRTRQYKRDLILKNLIPYPKQIDLINLRKFKDKYRDLLKAFSNKGCPAHAHPGGNIIYCQILFIHILHNVKLHFIQKCQIGILLSPLHRFR